MCACIHMHALGLITDSVKYLWEQGNTELNVESVVPKVFNHCIVCIGGEGLISFITCCDTG